MARKKKKKKAFSFKKLTLDGFFYDNFWKRRDFNKNYVATLVSMTAIKILRSPLNFDSSPPIFRPSYGPELSQNRKKCLRGQKCIILYFFSEYFHRFPKFYRFIAKASREIPRDFFAVWFTDFEWKFQYEKKSDYRAVPNKVFSSTTIIFFFYTQ